MNVLSVRQGGVFTSPEDIADAGRIPDGGLLQPKRPQLIVSKTAREVVNNVAKRVAPAPSSPIVKHGGQ